MAAMNDHTLPYWFSLLKYQQELGRTGLTPSFLIGAKRLSLQPSSMEGDTAYRELQSLLVAFRDAAPHPHHVVISKCTIHGQPIAALYLLNPQRAACEPVVDHRGGKTLLSADHRYFDSKRRNVESLVEGWWKIFESALTRGEFSFRDEAYAAFNDKDRDFITNAHKSTARGVKRTRWDKTAKRD